MDLQTQINDLKKLVQTHLHTKVDGTNLLRPKFKVYAGQIDDGTKVYLPDGWSSAKTGTGGYTITHNLGLVQYVVTLTAVNASSKQCRVTVGQTNTSFHMDITNGDGTTSAGTVVNFILVAYNPIGLI